MCEIGEAKLLRCVSCAKTILHVTPPDVMDDDTPAVPAPSLPIAPMRQPDFVSSQQLAQRNRYRGIVDARQRQTGEAE